MYRLVDFSQSHPPLSPTSHPVNLLSSHNKGKKHQKYWSTDNHQISVHHFSDTPPPYKCRINMYKWRKRVPTSGRGTRWSDKTQRNVCCRQNFPFRPEHGRAMWNATWALDIYFLTCVVSRDDQCVFVLSFPVQRLDQVQLPAGCEAERSRFIPAGEGVADLTISAQVIVTGNDLPDTRVFKTWANT